jgi:hypothetical protein
MASTENYDILVIGESGTDVHLVTRGPHGDGICRCRPHAETPAASGWSGPG